MERTGVSLAQDAAFFVALLATALALGGALAHVLELPNKIGMSREDYFIVQRVYLGWNCLAYLLLIELGGMLAVIFLYRAQPSVLWSALVALELSARCPSRFLGLHLPDQPGNEQLVRAARKLGNLTLAVGVFASGRGCLADARHGGPDRRCSAAQPSLMLWGRCR